MTTELEAMKLQNAALASRVRELEGRLLDRGFHGTLLLDYETARTSPVFFALQALLFRAAGLKILAVGVVGDDKLHAAAMIGYSDFKLLPHSPHERSITKFNLATQLLKDGHVIWPDLDFAKWQQHGLPNVNGIAGLIILDWTRVLRGGVKPDKVERV